MQVQARNMELLVVDHLFDKAHLLNAKTKENILKHISHELMRREDPALPPISCTNRVTLYQRGGNAALVKAIKGKQTDTALFLISHGGVKANKRDKEGFTPLHHAVNGGNGIIAEELLDAKALVNRVDNLGRTALWHAAANGNLSMLSLLLPYHSPHELNLADHLQRTPLIAAFFFGHPDIALELISHGAEVNAVDDQERSALHYAAYRDRYEIVEALIKKGAKVNVQTDGGDTPLHFCCYSTESCLNTLNALYKGGASLDAINSAGQTPLHFAVRAQNLSTFAWLLQHKALVHIYDRHGNDLRSFIKKHGDNRILEYFDRYLEDVRLSTRTSESK